MADVDAVVIGAGVIGLAIARRLARAGLSTIIIEAEDAIGRGTSSRNSEVIHAGLYYEGTPLKAALCVTGREELYRFCVDRHVPHKRLGKLVVAFDDAEIPALERLITCAEHGGVTDLRMLSGEEARRLEPSLDCAAAVLSPSTGIIDSHAYMSALLADAEAHGAILARRNVVTEIRRAANDEWAIHVADDPGAACTARHVVIAAGHGARAIAANTEGIESGSLPTSYYARGSYFLYTGAIPFTRLIYPLPVAGGLGTHLTLDLGGAGRFGPDVEWVETIDYAVGSGRKEHFLSAARRIWPEIDPDKLVPGYSGVRPKLVGPGAPAADFLIAGEDRLGVPNVILLLGIESPGLTASLAIANVVARQLAVAD